MAKTSITPPFLELSFYRFDRSNDENLHAVAVALLAYGASFMGIAVIEVADALRATPFTQLYIAPTEVVAFTTLDELQAYRHYPDRRVVQVYMTKIKGLAIGNPALLTLLSQHSERSYGMPAPVGLWVAGDMFSTPPDEIDPRASKTGRAAYRCFKFLVEHFRPDYANITVEVGLSTPPEVDSLDFLNCYVSHRIVSAEQLLAIAPPTAFIEPVADGHIIFSYDWARKWRRLVPLEAQDRFGGEVARLIAASPYYRSVG